MNDDNVRNDRRYLRCPYCGSRNVRTRKNSKKGCCLNCGLPFKIKGLEKIVLFNDTLSGSRKNLIIYGKGLRVSPSEIMHEYKGILPDCLGYCLSNPQKCTTCNIIKFCNHCTSNYSPKCLGALDLRFIECNKCVLKNFCFLKKRYKEIVSRYRNNTAKKDVLWVAHNWNEIYTGLHLK